MPSCSLFSETQSDNQIQLPDAKNWATRSVIYLQDMSLSSQTYCPRASPSNDDQVCGKLFCCVADFGNDVARLSKNLC
jgi:hypothetical protein